MEREVIEKHCDTLWLQSDGEEGEPLHNMCVAKAAILDEFDRLKLRVASLAADLWDANAALDEAQSWLGTISEPFRLGQIVPANILRCLREDRYKSNLTDVIEAIAAYLDSQKPSEKPPVYLFDSHLAMVEGKLTRHSGDAHDCPICNPKCEHKNIGVEWESQNKRWCPDCHEWVEKPNHIHSDDSGIFWEGAEKVCNCHLSRLQR
jgi:hypothetical protein